MLPELGQFILILAFSVALIQAVVPAMGLLRGRREWMGLARPAAYIQFCLVLGSYGILTYSFIVHDFSVLYVANTSNSELPLIYRISGVWGAHEGSLLLWVLIHAGWTAILAAYSKRYPPDLSAGIISVMGCISVGFLSFTIFTSNPFVRLFPVPVDGADLNPLLQDPAMAIHPPMLYMGYVGFSVPFAFAIMALVQGRLDTAWARWVRPWALTAWLCLTAGITLGQLVGLLRAWLGRLVVLGPGRECVIHALVSRHCTHSLISSNGKASCTTKLDGAACHYQLFVEFIGHIPGTFRYPHVGPFLCI